MMMMVLGRGDVTVDVVDQVGSGRGLGMQAVKEGIQRRLGRLRWRSRDWRKGRRRSMGRVEI